MRVEVAAAWHAVAAAIDRDTRVGVRAGCPFDHLKYSIFKDQSDNSWFLVRFHRAIWRATRCCRRASQVSPAPRIDRAYLQEAMRDADTNGDQSDRLYASGTGHAEWSPAFSTFALPSAYPRGNRAKDLMTNF